MNVVRVNIAQGPGEAEASRACSRARSPAGRRRSSSSSPARPSRSSRERRSNASPSLQAHQPRPPLHDGLRLRRGDEVEAREGADREADQEGRPEHQRPHHDAPPGRRPQAPLPDHRLQAQRRTASRRRSPRSSTTRTGRPGSRCSTTPTASSRTSSRPAGLRVGSEVASGPGADIKPGNALPLENIPTGTLVHNVELKPGKGGQMARSAGSGIQLVAKDQGYATLRLPSGEMRRVLLTCRATVGQVGNVDHGNITGGKAGRSRWLGQAADRPRLGDEPGRPSARRRRGQVEGRPPPGHPVGRADARQAHPRQAQGIGQAHRPRPAPREGEALSSHARARRGRSSRSACWPASRR